MNSKLFLKGYKQTKVGVIPEDWEVVRSDKVLQRIRKKVNVQKDEKYQQIGIRSHAKGLFHKELVTGEILGNKSVFWIEEDCFIVNIVFAWEQAVAKTSHKEKGMIASHRFPMYQAKDNGVDIDYLLYFFKSKRGKHLLGLASPGGAGRNKTLGQGEFNELKLPLPPLKEQQKIAKILSTWDNAIEKQEQIIEQKELLKKGVMERLLFNEKWETVKLKEIAEVIMGQSPSSNSYNDKKIGLPLIQGNADCQDRYTKPRMYTSEKTKECLIEDIIMTVRAPVGAISKSLHNACIGRGVCAIRPNNKNNFLYHFLVSFEKSWEKYSQGSTFTAVNSNDIKNLKIKVPSLAEQEKIAQILTLADKEIALLKDELSELKNQKKALMQKLLTGEVRVVI